VFVASLFVAARLEERVADQLATLLVEQGLDEVVSYERIDVSSIAGSVTAREVAITDPVSGDFVRADTVTLRVPRLEALRAREAIDSGNTEAVAFSSIGLVATGVRSALPDGRRQRSSRRSSRGSRRSSSRCFGRSAGWETRATSSCWTRRTP
jgi:hypothetical protein